MNSSDEAHARRLACQIFTELPDNRAEALHVLSYVRQILFNLGEDWPGTKEVEAVKPFPRLFSRDREGA